MSKPLEEQELPYDAEYERLSLELEAFTGVSRTNPRCFAAMQTNRIECRERQLRAALAELREARRERDEVIEKNREFNIACGTMADLVDKACHAGEAALDRAETAERQLAELRGKHPAVAA